MKHGSCSLHLIVSTIGRLVRVLVRSRLDLLVSGGTSIFLIIVVVDVELSADTVISAATTAAAAEGAKKDEDQEATQGDQNDSPNLESAYAVPIIIKINRYAMIRRALTVIEALFTEALISQGIRVPIAGLCHLGEEECTHHQ